MMSEQPIAAYGSWPSPVGTAALTADTVGLSEVLLDADTGLYWLESRPSEGGRTVLVHQLPDGQTVDVTPAPANVRSRVHEYGGGAAAVRGELVVYSEFADNRLYRLQVPATGAAPTVIETAPDVVTAPALSVALAVRA
jgi:hypothetical protein